MQLQKRIFEKKGIKSTGCAVNYAHPVPELHPSSSSVMASAEVALCFLTARLLADDSVCAVSAGAWFPQASVALDPEAGVWRKNREGDVMHLPVGVQHLRVLAPHETSTCSRNM